MSVEDPRGTSGSHPDTTTPPDNGVLVGGRRLRFPLNHHRSTLDSWPVISPDIPHEPLVPFPDQHWDWRAIHSQTLIDPSAWVAPGVGLYGRVRLGARSSIWFGCMLRGDQEWIEIGSDSNIQDGTILHVEHGGFPCVIGDRVTVGHRAVVHGAIVGDGALIGIGALVLSRCLVGEGALVAAGAVVLEGTRIPPHTLWAGCPARQIRELTAEQRGRLETTYQHYVNNTVAHRAAEQGLSAAVFLTGQPPTTE